MAAPAPTTKSRVAVKFVAKITEGLNLDTFIKSAQMIARLGKLAVVRIGPHSFAFVQNQTIKDGAPSTHLELNADKIFEHYSVNNADPASETFCVDVAADEFVSLLKTAASARSLSLRLIQKDSPHLQIFTRHQLGVAGQARTVCHNMPVQFVPRGRCADFAPLTAPAGLDVSINLPPVKTLHKVLAGFRGMNCKHVVLAANGTGDLELRLETEQITLTSYFSDLVNYPVDGGEEGGGDAENAGRMYNVRVDLKQLMPFVNGQQLTASRLVLNIAHHRYAYFTLDLDDLTMQYLLPNIMR